MTKDATTRKRAKQNTLKDAELAEAALLKRALGFRQDEESTEQMVDKNTGEVLEVLKQRRISKEVPPDVRALLFWLKNRCPERWSDRPGSEDDYVYEPDEDEREL